MMSSKSEDTCRKLFTEYLTSRYSDNRNDDVISYSKYMKTFDYLKDKKARYSEKFHRWVKKHRFCLIYYNEVDDVITHQPIYGDIYIPTFETKDSDSERDCSCMKIENYRKVIMAEQIYDILKDMYNRNEKDIDEIQMLQMVKSRYAFIPVNLVTYFVSICQLSSDNHKTKDRNSGRHKPQIDIDTDNRRKRLKPSNDHSSLSPYDTSSSYRGNCFCNYCGYKNLLVDFMIKAKDNKDSLIPKFEISRMLNESTEESEAEISRVKTIRCSVPNCSCFYE